MAQLLLSLMKMVNNKYISKMDHLIQEEVILHWQYLSAYWMESAQPHVERDSSCHKLYDLASMLQG